MTDRGRIFAAVAAALLGAAGALPAVAQEAPPPLPGNRPPCTCRANGQEYELGERACLSTPQGHRLATCTMSQNVTSWQVSGESCVVSLLLPSAPAQPRRTSQR